MNSSYNEINNSKNVMINLRLGVGNYSERKERFWREGFEMGWVLAG